MPFKTRELLEQAKVAIRREADRHGGRLITFRLRYGKRVCALGAMGRAAKIRLVGDPYNAIAVAYGLTWGNTVTAAKNSDARRIVDANDDSNGDPLAVCRVLDEIGVG